MAETIRAAGLGEIEEDGAIVLESSSTGYHDGIAVFHHDGRYYALDDTCTHEKASMAEGWVEDGQVECPLHAARFCLRDGAVQCLPATVGLRAHKVEVRDDGVYVTPGVAP